MFKIFNIHNAAPQNLKKDSGLGWSRFSEVFVVPSVKPLAAGLWEFEEGEVGEVFSGEF